MIRRVYSITGFDCAACADKSERHLQKDSRIRSARIDFVGERLYVEFKSEEVLPEVLKQVIAEVESDPIEITAVNEAKKSKDRKPLILTLRIAYCVLIFFLCGFLFKDLYWLRFSLYLSALLLIEYDILWKVVQNIAHLRNPLDEYLLISLASSGAFVLACLKMAEKGEARAFGNDVFQMEEHFEAVLVALLWQVGELLQTIAVRRSTRAIEKAVDSRVEEALLLEHGSLRRVAAASLHVGDVCRVNEAMAIPVDGEVVEGSGYCDTSSLTGESVPVALEKGSPVYSGTMLVSGEITVEAKKDYENSSSARILSLIHESLEKKGKAERFITKFARVYTPVIFLVALVYIVLAGFLGLSWRSAVYSGLEIMVISCPCALVISVPLAYFAAMGLSSKNGIVVKSACHLDSLTSFKTVITDKTGTLTKGKFSIAEIAVEEGIEEIHFRTLLAGLESSLSHPIAKAVVEGLGVEVSAPSSVTTLPGLGVQGEIHGKTYYAGNAKLAKAHGYKAVERFEGVVIYLFDEQVLYGHVVLEDELKPTSIKAVEALRKQGVSVNIYSGDAERNVAKTAEMLHVDSYRAELLPDEKLSLLEETKEKSQAPVCFLGDGVNDAPSLARADIGVAMGGLGSDLAVEEADVILLRDDPYSLVEARSIAKKNRSVIVVNIAFALAVKVAVMVLAMVLGESLPMEVAVLADTGVSVLCTLNSLLLLRRKP